MSGTAQRLADLEQALDDLRNENHRLNGELAQQQQNVAAIKAQRNQWNALPADVIQRRIEVMADPSSWDGNKAQFAEWWVKMRVWVTQNRTALPTDQDKAMAVWSRMKGPSAGWYIQAHFTTAVLSGMWPTWNELKFDVEQYFALQTEVEWCRKQLRELTPESVDFDQRLWQEPLNDLQESW
ncbi:hypothetical protein EDD15DRAFT_2159845 [Pisolithus albus]|nr:hypothetical protein EDD15DRAFT_2159845 [Pisolithus albus]